MKSILIIILLIGIVPGICLAAYVLTKSVRQPLREDTSSSLSGEKAEPIAMRTQESEIHVWIWTLTIPSPATKAQKALAYMVLVALLVYFICCLILLFYVPSVPVY